MEARSPSSQDLQNVGQWDKTTPQNTNWGPPWWLSHKESARNVGEAAEAMGSIPGLARSPGEGNGNPLQYSCLENSMDRGAWRLQSVGSQRVPHDWATNTFTFSQLRTIVHTARKGVTGSVHRPRRVVGTWLSAPCPSGSPAVWSMDSTLQTVARQATCGWGGSIRAESCPFMYPSCPKRRGVKIAFRNEVEIRTFLDKGKLK